MMETGAPRAGVAGWPVEHSRSPMIHRYWLEELGIAGTYEKFAVRPGEFRAFADRIGQDGLVGANVTVPHKEAAFNACDQRTPVAEALGAVNTLWRQDGRLMGDNTDVAGFLANMDESALGLGGAAEIGRRHWRRRRGPGDRPCLDLARLRTDRRRQPDASESRGAGRPFWRLDDGDSLGRSGGEAAPSADLLVNASSLGMVGQPPLRGRS